MAQIFYTTAQEGPSSMEEGIEVDLDELLSPPAVLKAPEVSDNSILVEDGDTFQCGKCLHQFSFMDFILHKKNICQGVVKLSDEGPEEMLTDPLPLPETEVPPSTIEDNNNEDILVDFNSDIFTFKVAEGANQTAAMLAEELEEFDPSSCIKGVDSEEDIMEDSPIIGSNCMLTHTIKETANEILLTEGANAQKLDVPVISIPDEPDLSESDYEQDTKSDSDDKCEDEDPESKIVRLYCCVCNKEFRKNFDLQQHLRSHTGERPFQCVVCGRAFAQKSNVMKHMATHKVWPKKTTTLPLGQGQAKDEKVPIQKIFMCQYCPSVFESYADLKSHKVQHLNEKVFKCVQKSCPETFKELDAFLEHTQTHTDMASYECHICHKEFNSLDDLGQHQIFHDGAKTAPKRVSCPHCKAKFMSSESLEKHLATDSHNYPCPTCDKMFSSERFLRRHISTHSPASEFACPVCQKMFRTEHYLNLHIIIHTDYKPYSCEICSASFNRRDKLSRHHLTHENAKRYKCPYSDICTKEFNRKDKLKRHITIHTTPQPDWKTFKCKYCTKGFTTASLLENHEFICGASLKKQVENLPPTSERSNILATALETILEPDVVPESPPEPTSPSKQTPQPEETPQPLLDAEQIIAKTGLTCEEIIRKALEPPEIVLKQSYPEPVNTP